MRLLLSVRRLGFFTLVECHIRDGLMVMSAIAVWAVFTRKKPISARIFNDFPLPEKVTDRYVGHYWKLSTALASTDKYARTNGLRDDTQVNPARVS